MKKIMVMLLGAVATINAMAVDYTAKAKVTLEAKSGYKCDLMLSEAAEYGALSGSKINMEGRVVALYVLNGDDSLQIARAADLRSVPLGIKTDGSASYTFSVTSVAGTETLYIHDGVEKKDYALTEGASYTFTAAADTESRFYLKKASSGELKVCFTDNNLIINDNPYDAPIVIKDANETEITGSPFAANTLLIDLTKIGAKGDRFTVEFAGGARKFVIVKE